LSFSLPHADGVGVCFPWAFGLIDVNDDQLFNANPHTFRHAVSVIRRLLYDEDCRFGGLLLWL